MTKVTMYKAADGSLHASQKDMDRHEENARVKPLAEQFVNGCANTEFSYDDRGNAVIYRDNLADFVANNADALRKMLADAKVVRKRPRQPKAAVSPAINPLAAA